MSRFFHSLSTLDWTLSGWTPYMWRQQRSIESGVSLNAEIPGLPAKVPGSVQGALRDAGIIPDWNVGLNARLCEWVENRHWIYTTRLPDEWLGSERSVRLRALGLDHSGWVLLNGKEVGSFEGAQIPHVFDLANWVQPSGNVLQIVFDLPPRWLGQIGYTSAMTDWKPRFNYFWDWTQRLVQIGIWDDISLEVTDGEEIALLDVRTAFDVEGKTGRVSAWGRVAGHRGRAIQLKLSGPDGISVQANFDVAELESGINWDGLDVDPWWPNGEGDHSLYDLKVKLLDDHGEVLDVQERRVGFKDLQWRPCQGAAVEADPWLCVVNGRPIFLQGVNWTPIRPNFADVNRDQYRHLLRTYSELGCNILRVWGGAFLEKELFYDLCDELGLLVWQEFPLSSSGLDNNPPEDPKAIEQMAEVASSYIQRRGRHVSLALWSGGNELQDVHGKPVDITQPLIGRLQQVVGEQDPGRRFLPTSPSGPSFSAERERFGQGVHWDVHGPWNANGALGGEWSVYWNDMDALFHSETGAPGASSVDLIRAYKGELDETPGTTDNPLWRRTAYWVEWRGFVAEMGREPSDLEEYVAWSQGRQSEALRIAASSAKRRFPQCGGFILWMGHDCFPCTANTSIIDFEGNPKPAAEALRAVFASSASGLEGKEFGA